MSQLQLAGKSTIKLVFAALFNIIDQSKFHFKSGRFFFKPPLFAWLLGNWNLVIQRIVFRDL